MRKVFSLATVYHVKKSIAAVAVAMQVFFIHPLMAQQTPLLSHYYYNPYLINPAMAGQLKETRAFLFYRQQWAGMPGAPQTQALTVDGPLSDTRFGLGLNINNDLTNIVGRFSAMLSSSYLIRLTEDQDLSFGLSLGILRNDIKFDKIRGDLTDAGLLLNAENRTVFDGNAGLSYRFKKLRIGFASEQLFNKSITYSNAADFRGVSYSLVRHYLVSAQYPFQLNENWELTPLLVLREAQGLPAQLDVNATLKYKDIGWTNVVYRHQSGVAMALGFNVGDRFMISYNYELPTSDLRTATSGSHEVMLGMRFLKKNSGGSSSKSINSKMLDEFRRDNSAQYERLDEIQQRNETLNQELVAYKKIIDEQNSEIEKLKKSMGTVDEELKLTIDQLKVDLQREGSFDKTFNYYLIIGAVRTLPDAKAFQKIIRRETRIKPEIIQNDNQTWYFVYSDQLKSVSEARQKIKELDSNNIRPYIIGNPWVYKSRKNTKEQ
jgi:type IX secretion system PorP/SprF family membrane protein